MSYDNWKTTNPDDDSLGSRQQVTRCYLCREEVDEEDPHIVEAFEVFGHLVCGACWDRHCEGEK